MSTDILLEISKNPTASRLVKSLGLPLPIPVVLKRAQGPMEDLELFDLDVVVAGGPNAAAVPTIARTLAEAGANPVVDGSISVEPFEGPGEVFGRHPQIANEESPKNTKPHGLVFDATGITTMEGLKGLHDFFQPWLRSLAKNGRLVVIGRPANTIADPEHAAAQSALSGFIRSVSKEVAAGGATANAIFVEAGAEERVAAPLRFLLGRRSAYLNGQPLSVWKKTKATDARWARSLEGQVALVTGAARGIGEEIARLMADEGAHVVVLDRPNDAELASKVARKIGGSTLLCDITDANAPKQIAETLKKDFGGVDIVIHNAGVTRDKMLRNMSDEYWNQAVDINIGAVIRINNELLSSKVLRDNGRIVCLSSVSGIAGNRGQTNYSAAKSGLIAYCEQLGTKLASRGITVNAIAPGFIETRLTAAMPMANREVARRLNSLGQGGQPVDVAQAVLFFSTPGAYGLTGNTVRVCGGMLIGA